MRDPAEVFFSKEFQAGFPEGRRILLERRQVFFFLRFGRATKPAAESRKPAVHIDHDADAPRREQIRNGVSTIHLLA